MTGNLLDRLPDLPIRAVLDDVVRTLSDHHRLVLEAPPGAGKTTMVPLALIAEGSGIQGKILMLEPRRLAARAAARRMAALLGEKTGDTVGYRVRMDTVVGPRTRIEVVTEGVLTRMLQNDPALSGVDVLIFDEFHERSLHSDLGLTLALDAQQALRPELRIVVMSATIASEAIAQAMGGAPVIRSDGQIHPVKTVFEAARTGERLADHTVRIVADAWNAYLGDILVFLPGEGEIRRITEQLEGILPPEAAIHPLYGNLPLDRQDEAIMPNPHGRRKVVLATSIAETSLTIEKIGIVVDSGLVRRPRWSMDTGLEILETRRISRASATQRAGRAGRVGPGVAIRLWSALVDQHLADFHPPEIEYGDLTALALEVACWGERMPERLPWPDPPPETHYHAARKLLQDLGAIDADGVATPHGRTMARLPLHPRIAHMIMSAPRTERHLACRVAALLSERDPFAGAKQGEVDPDCQWRLDAAAAGRVVDRRRLNRLEEVERQLMRLCNVAGGAKRGSASSTTVGGLLLEAYPDRLARSEGASRFRMRSGERVSVAESSRLATAEWIVAAHVTGAPDRRRVRLGGTVPEDTVLAKYSGASTYRSIHFMDEQSERVMTRNVVAIDSLVLSETTSACQDLDAARTVILDYVRRNGLDVLLWSRTARRLRSRAEFARAYDKTFPPMDTAALVESLDVWVGPFVELPGVLKHIDVEKALWARIGWERRGPLAALAPDVVRVPSGREVEVDYRDPEMPYVAVRMQEAYGWRDAPAIGDGHVRLIVHLLSPAGRPLQITRDLKGFWGGEYAQVRKEMRGRYPKHYWPEDPAAAGAIRGIRPPDRT